MHVPRSLWLLLIGLSLLAGVGADPAEARGQFLRVDVDGHGSHVPLPPSGEGEPDPTQRARLFQERLLRARGMQMFEDITKRGKPPTKEQLELLLNNPIVQEQLKAFESDPIYKEQITKQLEKQHGFTAQQLETAKRLLQDMGKEGSAPAPGGPPADPGQPSPPSALPSPPDTIPPTPNASGPSIRPSANGAAAASDPRILERRAQMAQRVLRWANRIQEMAPQLRDSQAMREAVRAFAQFDPTRADGSFELPALPEGLEGRLPAFVDLPPLEQFWPDRNWSLSNRLPSLSLPELHLPGSSMNWGGGPDWRVPRLGVPSGSFAGGWEVLWLVLLVILVGVLWQVVSHSRRQVASARTAAWKLGPWPVDPAAVRTRAELIRAFEHLSLLRLGLPARSWNHRLIAARLGSEETAATPERRQAARHLADLYEQARYTPTSEAMPEAALGAARRNLCLLAGVPAA